MTVRALLTALLLGGAVVGSRLLAGPLTVPPQDTSAVEHRVTPAQQGHTGTDAEHRPAHGATAMRLSIQQSVGAASAEVARAARYSS